MKKGFTLIELLVVIAIIGILASITLVSLASGRKKASIAAFKTSVGSLAAAMSIECEGNPATIADVDISKLQADNTISSIDYNPSHTSAIDASYTLSDCNNGSYTVDVFGTSKNNNCKAVIIREGIIKWDGGCL